MLKFLAFLGGGGGNGGDSPLNRNEKKHLEGNSRRLHENKDEFGRVLEVESFWYT